MAHTTRRGLLQIPMGVSTPSSLYKVSFNAWPHCHFSRRCIFIPDNGAFFVNYVITSAFIGTAAELVRIPELLLYAIKLACAKSQAERTSVRKVGGILQNLMNIHLYESTPTRLAFSLCYGSSNLEYSMPGCCASSLSSWPTASHVLSLHHSVNCKTYFQRIYISTFIHLII